MSTVHLRPLAVTRVANCVPGVAIALAGSAAGFSVDGLLGLALALSGEVVGVVLMTRGYRMGVRCAEGAATVNGLFATRSVRRQDIVEVTVFPAIRWRSSGKVRWTPVIAFATLGRELSFVAQHNDRCADQLRRWVAERPRRT